MPSDGQIWLDVSRLLWRIHSGVMTGIDRVDIAYAEHLLRDAPERLHFIAADYWLGGFRLLPDRPMRELVPLVSRCWNVGIMHKLRTRSSLMLLSSLFTASRPLAERKLQGRFRPVYLNVSMHPVQWTDLIARLLNRTGAAFVPLVHDLIPLEHPEYVPPSWTVQHRNRMETIRSLASGVIANSATTAHALSRVVSGNIPILTARLGVTTPPKLRGQHRTEGTPYFICLGTIEPRKNHLVLLNVWRRLVETLGPEACPRLLIIGRRGWQNEHVLNLLERCRAIGPVVQECGHLSDFRIATLLAECRALLMPSFTEGYGLPVSESLVMGVPVICSDIPAHREVGGCVPDFLDPLDGPGWLETVMDYARQDSPARQQQIDRMNSWEVPSWDTHIEKALSFIEFISRRPVVAPQQLSGNSSRASYPNRSRLTGGVKPLRGRSTEHLRGIHLLHYK